MATKFNAAFWKWFGDSKVVDAKGRPLVVYHGTDQNFTSFKTPAYFSNDSNYAEFFTVGNGSVIPAYLFIKNPLDLTKFDAKYIPLMEFSDWLKERYVDIDDSFANYYSTAKAPIWAFVRNLTKNPDGAKYLALRVSDGGYDGIKMIESNGSEKSVVWLPLKPSQIKSAIGNDGTWDADDPDIRSNPINSTTLFHGTNGEFVESIFEHGIKNPYLTDVKEIAVQYADATSGEGDPVVFVLKDLDDDCFVVDKPSLNEPVGYGKITGKQMDEKVMALMARHTIEPKDWRLTFPVTRTLQYKGVVKPDRIKDFYVVEYL